MRLFTIAAAMGFALFATTASAQSLFSEQYVSIAGGIAGSSDHTVQFPENAGSQTNELDAAPAVQLAFGTQAGNYRLEGAFGYRNHDATSVYRFGPNYNTPSDTSAEFTVRSLDLNVFYDLPTNSALRPYVGAGIGVAAVHMQDALLDDEDSSLQLQAMAGASYAVSPRAAVFVEGRFQRVGNITIETQIIDGGTGQVRSRLEQEFDISNAAAFAGVRFGF